MTADLNPVDTALRAFIARRIGALADQPEQLRAFINGVALDGSLRKAGLPSGLAPYMALPGPEPKRVTRARMAELITRRVSADGNVTRDDLLGGGFTQGEIDEHYRDALRISGAMGMAA